MRYLIILILLILAFQPIQAQTVTILDMEDGKPVADVAVCNTAHTLFYYSSPAGKVSLSEFKDDQLIYFQHFSYEHVSFTKEELKKARWIVRLKTKIFEVEEFIVSANRWEQKSDEVPNHISFVSAPVIRFTNPQTTADLVSTSGEVYVQKSQLGGGSPMMRGFATNRVLIVIDGVRMNNAIYREGNIQNIISLDPNIIDRTEIIFGPGATIYGSDAIGGVMDFHTKKALFSTSDTAYFKAEAMARYSSASKEKTGHIDLNIGGRKLSFLSSFSWSDFGDLRMGSKEHSEYLRLNYQANTSGGDLIVTNEDARIQVGTGYSQFNTMNKLRFKAGKYLDINLANHYSHISDVPRYDRLIQEKNGTLRYGDWYYGPQVWVMTDMDLHLTKPSAIYDEMRLIIGRQDYRESRHDRKIGDKTLNEQVEKVKIWSLNLDLDKSLNNNRELLYYGLEYIRNDIKSTADTMNIMTGMAGPAGSRYPNGKNIYNSFALYGGYKNNLSAKLTFNTGLRYNFVSLNSNIADNQYYNFPFTEIETANSAVTGAAGIVYRPDNKSEFTFNISTGFRAPNLDDLGKVFESAPGVVVVPNPDLKPEYIYNADIGISKDFSKILHTEFTGFFSWLDNAMVRREFLFNGEDSILYQGELSGVYALTNAGYAIVYGATCKLEFKPLSVLRIKSILTFTEGHDDADEPLRHVPPLFGSTHVVFEKHSVRADLYAVYNGSKTFKNLAPSEKDKAYLYAADKNGDPWSPGWWTLNFKASYNLANRMEIATGVENILDLRYRPYSSGIVSPGRNYIISLRVLI